MNPHASVPIRTDSPPAVAANDNARQVPASIDPQFLCSLSATFHVNRSSTNLSQSQPLVKRRFTKRLPGFNNSTYAERLSRLNLPTLELRRLQSDLTWCYKILFGCVDMDSVRLFSVSWLIWLGCEYQCNQLERFVFEMTYNVLIGTFNSTRSLM